MTPALVFYLGVSGLFIISATLFVAWLLWSLAWHLFDTQMQFRTRRRRNVQLRINPLFDRNLPRVSIQKRHL